MLSALVNLITGLSARAWAEIVVAGILVVATAFAYDWYQSGQAATWSPRIESAEEMDVGNLSAEEWSRLFVHEPPTNVDTTCSVVPESLLERPDAASKNGLPEVTYSKELLEMPDLTASGALPDLTHVVVPMVGSKPALTLTPETATLRAVHPGTGGGMTFVADVPQDRWAVDIRSGVTLGRFSVAGTSTAGLRRMWPNWTARIGVGVGAGVRGRGAGAGPVVTASLTRDLWSWQGLFD